MWEILAAIKQPGNQRLIKVHIQAPDQIIAKSLLKAQYAGSNVVLRGMPRPVDPLKPKK